MLDLSNNSVIEGVFNVLSLNKSLKRIKLWNLLR
jgi:hypothetical protein